LKREIINKSKFLLLSFVLLFLSCQKDYYLDDLNDALDQIQSLQARNTELSNKITELGIVISQKTSENNILQSQYNQLYADFLESEAENEDLNNRLEALAEQLRQQIAVDNGIRDGYYLERRYKSIRNDTIQNQWPISNSIDFESGIISKVFNGEITEMFSISWADGHWDSPANSKFIKKLYENNFSYHHKNERDTLISINPYTGDSLAYMDNYKVYDHDIFTADEIHPINSRYNSTESQIINTNVYYKLYSEPYELTENIVFPSIVFDLNGYSDINQYPNIYDYYSENQFMSDSIYSQIDQDDAKSYLNAFILDAQRNGVDLSNINSDELILSNWDFPSDQLGREGVVAWGSITCSQTNNEIGYDISWFKNHYLTDKSFHKLKVMFHEFGHTVLGLKHTCAIGHIMTSGSSGEYACNGEQIDDGNIYNLVDFKRAVAYMFEGYNQFYYDCYLTNTDGEEIFIE